MNIKEKIENNVVTVLLSILLGTVAITYSLVNYFHEVKLGQNANLYKIELQKYQKELASIKRGVGKNDYYDVRSLLINSKSNSPDNSNFFAEESLYSLKNSDFFEYKKMDYFTLFSELIDENNSIFEMALGVPKELGKLIMLHVWKSNEEYVLEGDFGFKKLFPYITLQHIKVSTVEKMGNNSIPKMREDWVKNNKGISDFLDLMGLESFNEFIENTINSYESDILRDTLGSFLTRNTLLSMQSKNYNIGIDDIQKTGNVTYLRLLITFKNLQVNGKYVDSFYGIQEVFLIEENKSFYAITATLPSESPIASNQYNAEVAKWLNAFKIYAN